jgi:uncharacterized protein YlxP (DUF503 family)
MIIFPIIPICALLIQTSYSLYDILQYREEVGEIEIQVKIIPLIRDDNEILVWFTQLQVTHATDLGKMVTRLQFERVDVAFYIYTNNSAMIENLQNRFNLTNEAINNMTTWTDIKIPTISNDTDDDVEVWFNRTSFIDRLDEFRNKIIKDENREHNVFEVIGLRRGVCVWERVRVMSDWLMNNLFWMINYVYCDADV